MSKYYLLWSLLVLSHSSFGSTNDSKVKVQWKDSQNFSDINPGRTNSKRKFQKKLFKELEQSFVDNLSKLPPNLTIEVTFLDIDLAGHTTRLGIRTINDHDFPRLKFYVVVKDGKGNVILQGLQNLKETKDKHNAFRMFGSQTDFYLESALIEKWIDLALAPSFVKLN